MYSHWNQWKELMLRFYLFIQTQELSRIRKEKGNWAVQPLGHLGAEAKGICQLSLPRTGSWNPRFIYSNHHHSGMIEYWIELEILGLAVSWICLNVCLGCGRVARARHWLHQAEVAEDSCTTVGTAEFPGNPEHPGLRKKHYFNPGKELMSLLA